MTLIKDIHLYENEYLMCQGESENLMMTISLQVAYSSRQLSVFFFLEGVVCVLLHISHWPLLSLFISDCPINTSLFVAHSSIYWLQSLELQIFGRESLEKWCFIGAWSCSWISPFYNWEWSCANWCLGRNWTSAPVYLKLFSETACMLLNSFFQQG